MYNIQQAVQERAVEGAATVSAASAGVAWLPVVNEILTTTATLVAIASGVLAFVWHRRKLKALAADEAHKQEVRRIERANREGREDVRRSDRTEG